MGFSEPHAFPSSVILGTDSFQCILGTAWYTKPKNAILKSPLHELEDRKKTHLDAMANHQDAYPIYPIQNLIH